MYAGSIMGQKWSAELEQEKYGSSKLDMDVMDSLKTHEKLYTPGRCIFISGDEVCSRHSVQYSFPVETFADSL